MKEKTPGRKKCCRESFRLLRRKTCKSLTSSVKFSATVSFGNVKWKRDTHGKAMSAVNTVDQGFCSYFSEFLQRNMYCGQHGRKILSRLYIIYADNRNIFRYSKIFSFNA